LDHNGNAGPALFWQLIIPAALLNRVKSFLRGNRYRRTPLFLSLITLGFLSGPHNLRKRKLLNRILFNFSRLQVPALTIISCPDTVVE